MVARDEVSVGAGMSTSERRLSPPIGRVRFLHSPRANAGTALTSYGVLLTFGLAFALFSILRPSVFPTWGNMADILSFSVIQGMIAVGVTLPLIMNDFDLSASSAASLGGAVVAVLTAQHGVS